MFGVYLLCIVHRPNNDDDNDDNEDNEDNDEFTTAKSRMNRKLVYTTCGANDALPDRHFNPRGKHQSIFTFAWVIIFALWTAPATRRASVLLYSLNMVYRHLSTIEHIIQ